jgi:hypothetical protein
MTATAVDEWRLLDPRSKDKLAARIKAELINKGRDLVAEGLVPDDPTPSALAARCVGDRWRHRAYHDVMDQIAVDMLAGTLDRAIVETPPQIGKALAIDTPIATPTGWTTMGELRPGDRVFNELGEPCTVTRVSPVWTDRECYEVVADGENSERIVASGEHEWVASLGRRSPARVVETHVLANGAWLTNGRYVYARKVETVPTVCIEVDSPSHMFLAGRSLLPTCNSTWLTWFVLWWQSKHPDHPAILMSYAAQLASNKGRQIRTLVEDHGGQFGLVPTPSQWAKNNWLTRTGAGLVTGGMQTGVSGNPAALMMIDDAFGGREDADSRIIRQKVYDEYSGSLLSRMRPGAPLLIVNTRWHEDDLVGRVVKDEGREDEGGRWRVATMPALAREANDPLGRPIGAPLPHPFISEGNDLGALEHWNDKKRTSTKRDWASLYQADPQPVEGALLKDAQATAARCLGALPEFTKTVVGVDPSGGGRDNAGIIAAGRDWSGRVVWTHDETDVMTIDEWPEVACMLAFEVKAAEFVVEHNFGADMGKRILRTAWAQLQREGQIPEDFPCPSVVQVNAKLGKRLRAEPIVPQILAGQIQFAGLKMLSLENTWCTWQEDSNESPGDLDAAVYAAYRLAKIPGAEAAVSVVADKPKATSGRSKVAQRRIAR